MQFKQSLLFGIAASLVAAAPFSKRSSGLVFSPYKDVTVNLNWNTNVISSAVTGTTEAATTAMGSLDTMTWAFATGVCNSENWGGLAADDFAAANVQAWNSAGKKYIVSTGGAAGTFTCTDDSDFSSFIDRYYSDSLVGIDFDIEGGQSTTDIANLVARVKTAQSNSKYANLRFSFTVATLGQESGQNLGTLGQEVLSAIQSAGLTNYYINLMTMDYGSASSGVCTLGSDGLCDMGASAVNAAKTLNAAGVPYANIELTPMIGGNDTQDETFTIADVQTVASFATANGLGGVHYWSFDRDNDCAPGSSSATCNTYGQAGTLGFLNAFQSAGL